MAQHLAKIFGTEEDKVNCPFYLKMGACRHGDRCSRIHNRPILSQTILLQNMFLPPPQQYGQDGLPIPQDEDMLQDHFEEFYEDIFEELTNIGGDLEQLRVCENLSDHLTGNVYAKFREEEDAEKALKALMVARPAPPAPCPARAARARTAGAGAGTGPRSPEVPRRAAARRSGARTPQGRFYAGRPILAQFCPVTDFKDARCRQFEEATCGRGGYCNFMHLKKVLEAAAPAPRRLAPRRRPLRRPPPRPLRRPPPRRPGPRPRRRPAARLRPPRRPALRRPPPRRRPTPRLRPPRRSRPRR